MAYTVTKITRYSFFFFQQMDVKHALKKDTDQLQFFHTEPSQITCPSLIPCYFISFRAVKIK